MYSSNFRLNLKVNSIAMIDSVSCSHNVIAFVAYSRILVKL